MSKQLPAGTVEIQGFALRVIRVRSGRKTADLASSLQCDRSYITKIENGHSRRVSGEFYSQLLAELQIEDRRALLASPFAAAGDPNQEAAA